MPPGQAIVPAGTVERAIHVIRGQRVMLDSDLAVIYGTTTARVNEQVKRNSERFPNDFMFRLTPAEWTALKSHSATSNPGRGGRRKLPFAFTEHGAVMLANVLSTPRAVSASIIVVRTFIRLRELLATHADLARKIDELERRYNGQFRVVFEALRKLMAEPAKRRSRIGFH
jgi:hypothetical protein